MAAWFSKKDSTLMFDICNVFKNLQKVFQKSNLILLNNISGCDAAIVNLNGLKVMPLRGEKKISVGTDESCGLIFEPDVVEPFLENVC